MIECYGCMVVHMQQSYPSVPGEQVDGAEERKQRGGRAEHGAEGKGEGVGSSLADRQADSK